ncbi:recombinase family protein [Vibrio campbellii]|uniref:recombinase family protein n=1 Tax=Vibrio campbellii TaxID=680 RepID=UPI003857810E
MKTKVQHINKLVIYKRLSTNKEKQTSSFEVQDDYNRIFIDQHAPQAEVVAVFEEERSGGDNDRPMLKQALDLCEETGATLLVAKLDRLGRDVALVANVIKRVELKVALMPFADNFQLHIYAALAEQEMMMIRERVKDGMRKAKERGSKIGHPNAKQHMAEVVAKAGTAARSKAADERAKDLEELLAEYVSDGKTLARIAHLLNIAGRTTPRGKSFTATAVRRMLVRLGLPTNASQALPA